VSTLLTREAAISVMAWPDNLTNSSIEAMRLRQNLPSQDCFEPATSQVLQRFRISSRHLLVIVSGSGSFKLPIHVLQNLFDLR
jgi:hypothetical protein